MLCAGIAHLSFSRTAFQALVPTWITTDESIMDMIVLASGVVEIIFGIFMIMGGKLKIKTGIALAIFFILVVLGNIHQYVNNIDSFGLNTDNKRCIRLLFQPILILWALWSTGAITYLKSKLKK